VVKDGKCLQWFPALYGTFNSLFTYENCLLVFVSLAAWFLVLMSRLSDKTNFTGKPLPVAHIQC
jgi:hypothetical protein